MHLVLGGQLVFKEHFCRTLGERSRAAELALMLALMVD